MVVVSVICLNKTGEKGKVSAAGKRGLAVSSKRVGKREEKHEITGVSKKVGRAVYLLPSAGSSGCMFSLQKRRSRRREKDPVVNQILT